MFKSHLRNGNRLYFHAYLWRRCWKHWFTFDMQHSAYAVTDELAVGLGSLPCITFSRSQVDVLTILHETMLMLFSRISVRSSGRSVFSPFARDCCLWWQKWWLYLEPPSSTTQNASFNELQHLSGQAFHMLLNLLNVFFSLFLILNRSFTAEMLGSLFWVIEMAWAGRKC